MHSLRGNKESKGTSRKRIEGGAREQRTTCTKKMAVSCKGTVRDEGGRDKRKPGDFRCELTWSRPGDLPAG